MGRDLPAITITRQDRRAYREKARTCLEVLERLLRESRFEAGSRRIGLEIEFNLVDRLGHAAMTNAAVLAAIDHPAWTSELGQFNIELDSEPATLAGRVFSWLESSLGGTLAHAFGRAETVGSRVMMVGILPSLRRSDIGAHTISANPRYQLLNDEMLAARGEEMVISIDGQERLVAYTDHILPEAACTSVQCHLQVGPDMFAPYWNAAQAIAGIQVALGANSPYLLRPGAVAGDQDHAVRAGDRHQIGGAAAPGRQAPGLVRRAVDLLGHRAVRGEPAVLSRAAAAVR